MHVHVHAQDGTGRGNLGVALGGAACLRLGPIDFFFESGYTDRRSDEKNEELFSGDDDGSPPFGWVMEWSAGGAGGGDTITRASQA